ncbi:MAG: peroxiredoxin family protein [Saprospiraceae bacterium]
MRVIFSFFLVLNCFIIQGQEQEQAFEILEKTYQKLTNLESISYTMSHSSKLYWKQDTTHTLQQFPVHIYKKPYKNYSNGVFIFEQFEMFTSEKEGFQILNNPQCLHDLKIIETNFPKYFHLTESQNLPKYSINDLAHIYFINPDLLFLLKAYPVTVNKIKAKRKKYWQFIFTIKNDEKKRDRTIELWINRKTQHIKKMINRYQYNNFDGVQYDEWEFQNITENAITTSAIDKKKADFDKKSLMKMYANRKESSGVKTLKLLSLGTPAPSFEGWNVMENRAVHSSEFLGIPTVLCFWGKNMFQRDSTLKFFSDLNYKYAHLGMNTLGLIVGQKEGNEFSYVRNMQIYVELKNILFPTILIDDDTNSTYNAISFPEIYILDSDGIIIKTYIGLCDSYKNEIENILNNLLNE